MSNELIKLNENQISSASTNDLKKEFARGLTITSEYLMYMSAIWNELNQRGEDLTDLRSGMMEYMPMIATKQLDAELVVKYAGQKTLLSYLSKLTKKEQSEIVKTGCVDFITVNEEGIKSKKLTLSSARASDLHQAFDPNRGVRSLEEQEEIVLAKERRKTVHRKSRAVTKILIETGGQNIVAGGKSIKIESILEAVGDYYKVDLVSLIK